MDVRVVERGAGPGVQHSEKTRGRRSEVAKVAGEFEDRRRCGLHDDTVEDLRVSAGERAHLLGQSKGEMVKGGVQEEPPALGIEPAAGLFAVALGAVAVPAGVGRRRASDRIEGEAEVYATFKLREAESTLAEKFLYHDVAKALIDRAPEIAAELMAPAKQIQSIRVLDINGLGTDGGEASGAGSVINAFLRSSAALPLLREILDFAGIDREKALAKIVEKVPVLREAARDPAASQR
jgi:flotillin-like protein